METIGNRERPDRKDERMDIRKRISDLLFEINQVSIRTENDLDIDSDIRKGEVQSQEFIDHANKIVNNDAFWDSLPENKESKFVLHGQEHIKIFDKQSARNELAILVEQHDSL